MDRRVFLTTISELAVGGYFMTNLNPFNERDHTSGKKELKSGTSDMLMLFLCGDVMTGRGIDQILPFSVDPRIFEPYAKNAKNYVELAERKYGKIPEDVSFQYVWGDSLKEFKHFQPDFRIINLETAITESGTPWQGKSIHYRMHPGNTSILNAADIDVCVLGNNHILDWGYSGLQETLDILRSEGIKTAGAGEDPELAAKPAIVKHSSGRLLVFSYGFPTAGVSIDWMATEEKAGINLLPGFGSESVEKVIENIQSYRKEGDRVLISVHWGVNYGYEIPRNQQKFAHQLLDSELVDVVHGHSSHHPKAVEVYNDRLILYGCGDLINDYEGIRGREEYRSDLRLLYFPKLDLFGKLISLEMSPLKIRRFQLKHTSEGETRWLAETLDRECSQFGTSVEQSSDGRLRLSW